MLRWYSERRDAYRQNSSSTHNWLSDEIPDYEAEMKWRLEARRNLLKLLGAKHAGPTSFPSEDPTLLLNSDESNGLEV